MKRAVLIIWVLVVAGLGTAHADKATASRHFKAALEAEKRSDWATAAEEYKKAYAASPHPSVLFNIGEAYEKLGNGRLAARYFRRYLRERPDAKDRRAVYNRIRALEKRSSQLTITCQPSGAAVYVDGRRVGKAPLTMTLGAGRHRVYVIHGGRRSPERTVLLAYGDPGKVHIDLDVAPGRLVVTSPISGAEVTLDGSVVGDTPLDVLVPPGTYAIQIAKVGFQSDSRQVTITSRGTQQVRANLVPLPGTKVPSANASEAPTHPHYLFGTAYGLDLEAEGARYLLEVGYSLPKARLDFNALLGVVGIAGASAGLALGVEAKLYFRRAKLRPYFRAALLSAKTTSGEGFRYILTEGSVGIAAEGRKRRRTSKLVFEYFLEVGVSVRVAGGPDTMPGEDEPPRFGIPIVGGILFRFGAN